VRQKLYFPADDEKVPLLLGLLSRSEGARTMVFVNTKAYVERVARALERGGYRVGVLSGDVPQKKRESLLGKFQKGQLEILVATDVAARGLHIEGVSHVFNYDLPFDAEDYVHRIGRTARLGAEGDAISFACERYSIGLPDIEAYIEQKIPVEPMTPELLVALPRTPRVRAEGEAEDEEAQESVSQIFREVREAQAAEGGRGRGGPRSGGGSSSGPRRDGGRSGGERSGGAGRSRSGERSGPRPPRREEGAASTPRREEGGASAPAASGERRERAPRPERKDAPAHATPVSAATASAPAAEAAAEGAAKSRRRRGGRGRNRRNETAGNVNEQPAASEGRATPAAGKGDSQPSLLGRIKQGVSRFFKRPTTPRH